MNLNLRQTASTLYERFFRHFNQPGSAIGLGIFRILYSAVLLGEIHQIIENEDLFFGTAPGDNWHLENDLTPLLWAWWLSTVLFGLGLWIRPLSIANYILTVTFLGTFDTFQYHVDYYFVGMSLLLLIFPESTAFSLRWKPSQPDHRPAATASWGYVFMLVALGVGFVYVDSIFQKLDSPMWTSGQGLYTPASLPHNTWINPSWALDNEWLIRGMGYFTLIFETVFIFLLPFQRFRLPLAVGGLALHLGICVFFPIPLFALGVAVLYAVMIPDRVWTALLTRLRIHTPKTAPLFVRSATAPRWLAGLAAAAVLTLAQILCTATSPLVFKQFPQPVASTLGALQHSIYPFARKFTGITPHGVFMDSHFANFNHFVTLVYQRKGKEKWLPLIGQNGLADPTWTGRLWVNYTFRTLRAGVDPNLLGEGLRRQSWFWARRNGVSLNDAQFVIRMKKEEPAFQWRKGAFQQNLASPWIDIGTVTWKKQQCTVILPDVESL